MKNAVANLAKKVLPEKTDDLLEVAAKIPGAQAKRPWIALAKKAYRLLKSGR